MADVDEPGQSADEAAPFLARDTSEHSHHGGNKGRSVWLKQLLHVSRTARAVTTKLSFMNVLWVFLPLGLAGGAFQWNSPSTSIFNFLAIIPLSAAVSDLSDKLSDAFGDLLGALINATFGNAVELTVRLCQRCNCSSTDRDPYR